MNSQYFDDNHAFMPTLHPLKFLRFFFLFLLFLLFPTFIIIGDIVLKVWCVTNGGHAISTFVTINLVVYVLQLNVRILRHLL